MKLSTITWERSGASRKFTTVNGRLEGEIIWFKDGRYHIIRLNTGQEVSLYGMGYAHSKADWADALAEGLSLIKESTDGTN